MTFNESNTQDQSHVWALKLNAIIDVMHKPTKSINYLGSVGTLNSSDSFWRMMHSPLLCVLPCTPSTVPSHTLDRALAHPRPYPRTPSTMPLGFNKLLQCTAD